MILSLIAIILFLASPIFIGPALAMLRILGERTSGPVARTPEAPARRRALPPAA